jgi:site-specific recombinase XerD
MNKEQTKLLNVYLEELSLLGKNVSRVKSPLQIYFKYLNNLNIDLHYIKVSEAQNYQYYLSALVNIDGKPKYQILSINTMITAVSSFYNYLKNKNLIIANPFTEIKRIKLPKALPRNILNEKDMNKLLNSLKDFNKGKDLIERKNLYKAHVVAELMYSTGARMNEVVKLKKEDINFYRGTIKLKDDKTGKEREGILNSYCEKVLRIYVEEMKDYIVSDKNGGNKDLLFGSLHNLRMSFPKIINKQCEKLKLGKFKNHNLRHAFAVHLLKAGCDIRYIQDMLGHESLTSTQIYTKISKEDLKSVIDKFHPRSFKRSVTA